MNNPFESFKKALNEGVENSNLSTYYTVSESGEVSKLGEMTYEEAKAKAGDEYSVMTSEDFAALREAKKKKPSAGLTKKQKTAVVKKAKQGKDIGKKGKGFKAVEKAAEKQYGDKETAKKVAAAALWKNVKR